MRLFAYERTGDNHYEPVFAFDIFPSGLFFVDMIITTDMDGDGRNELLMTIAGSVLIIRGNGPGDYGLFYYKPVSQLYGASGVDVDRDGYAELLVSRLVDGGLTEVYRLDSVFTTVSPSNPLPTTVLLHQNYPNPFNSETQISFKISNLVHVELSVIDLLGRTVTVLVDDVRDAGEYTELWDGTGDKNALLASGMYFVRLKSGNYTVTRKMLLIR